MVSDIAVDGDGCRSLYLTIAALAGFVEAVLPSRFTVTCTAVFADCQSGAGCGAAGVLLVGKGFSAGIAGQRMSLAVVIGGSLYIAVTQTDREIICFSGCGSQLEGGCVDISVCQLNANGHFALAHGNQHGGPGVAILPHADRALFPGGSQDAGCTDKVSREIDAVQFHCSHALAIRQTGNVHCQLCHFPFKGQIHRCAGNLCGAVEGLVVPLGQIIVKDAVFAVGVIGGNLLATSLVIEAVFVIRGVPVGGIIDPLDIASRIAAAIGIVIIGNRDTYNCGPFDIAKQYAIIYHNLGTLGNLGCLCSKFVGILDLRRADTCQCLTDRGLHRDLVARQRFDATVPAFTLPKVIMGADITAAVADAVGIGLVGALCAAAGAGAVIPGMVGAILRGGNFSGQECGSLCIGVALAAGALVILDVTLSRAGARLSFHMGQAFALPLGRDDQVNGRDYLFSILVDIAGDAVLHFPASSAVAFPGNVSILVLHFLPKEFRRLTVEESIPIRFIGGQNNLCIVQDRAMTR